ncbi:MAG: hypothetical protein ACI9KE_003194 [Polyangiales bacterium]|jgi:hypothetical protein
MSKTVSLILLTSLLALGCEQDGSIGADDLIAAITRTDDGSQPPTSGDAVILWTISSGSPDYEYIAGRGSLTSTGFEVTLPASMPAEALNSYGIGVGIVLAFDTGMALEDGRVPDTFEESTVIGATPNYAIIYVAPDAGEGPDWANDFPTGFSCGVGVEGTGTFDSFEPVRCDLVELQIGDVESFDFVNWT